MRLVAIAVQCGVLAHAEVIDAIVRVESQGNPNALAVNGPMELVRQPATRAEATAMARWLLAHGFNFDAGLGQVNSANFSRLGLDAENAFDPCTNLRAASRVFEECHERARARWRAGETAMTAALSCYNTGDFTKGVWNGYAASVRAQASGPLQAERAAWMVQPTSRSGRAGGAGAAPRREVEVFRTALTDVFGAVEGAAVR